MKRKSKKERRIDDNHSSCFVSGKKQAKSKKTRENLNRKSRKRDKKKYYYGNGRTREKEKPYLSIQAESLKNKIVWIIGNCSGDKNSIIFSSSWINLIS